MLLKQFMTIHHLKGGNCYTTRKNMLPTDHDVIISLYNLKEKKKKKRKNIPFPSSALELCMLEFGGCHINLL